MSVSAYTTSPEETDDTPCISASGDNVCGRAGVVACPRRYPFGSQWIINGNIYTCLDRMNRRYDCSFDNDCIEERLDILMDTKQKARAWGIKRNVMVGVYD